MSVHMLSTPIKEIVRRSEGERWCFVCRERREFAYVIAVGLSSCGPTHKIICTHCQTTDGDCFPGSEREWA